METLDELFDNLMKTMLNENDDLFEPTDEVRLKMAKLKVEWKTKMREKSYEVHDFLNRTPKEPIYFHSELWIELIKINFLLFYLFFLFLNNSAHHVILCIYFRSLIGYKTWRKRILSGKSEF